MRRRIGSSVELSRCLAVSEASGVWAIGQVAARGDVMPSPTTLRFQHPGTEFLCMLDGVMD
jgi:hypothetical protein